VKQVVVLSGKGGTGKTTVAAALAHLASRERRVVLADADVDAANLELVLSPRKLEVHQFIGGKQAVIDRELCTGCGSCREVCRFEAVLPEGDAFRVDPIGCEGCASCFYRCPSGAIRMEDQVAGRWFVSSTRFGPLVHAHLFAAQENSGKLVMQVKQRAREIAEEQVSDYLIVDGPPGIGCPVIAACSGADLALLVAEPSVAGVHDLERMLATTSHFKVPALVAINKHDVNPARAREIEAFCEGQGVPVVARIPFDTAATAAMVAGKAVTERAVGPLSRELEQLWEALAAAKVGAGTCT
jgi:MinD superfamily P-loop ATPase